MARRHAFHPLRVKRVVEETADTRSFVLDVPPELASTYRYRPGQFCTFRVRIGADEHFRCYSMSSAPGIDADLAVTVKRVPGGAVSNWFNDAVVGRRPGRHLTALGVLLPGGGRPSVRSSLSAVAAGSRPVLSIAKRALASTDRPVCDCFYANRDPESVIFDAVLADLESRDAGAVHGAPGTSTR